MKNLRVRPLVLVRIKQLHRCCFAYQRLHYGYPYSSQEWFPQALTSTTYCFQKRRYSFKRTLTQFMSINRNFINLIRIPLNTSGKIQSYFFFAMGKSHHNNSGLDFCQISITRKTFPRPVAICQYKTRHALALFCMCAALSWDWQCIEYCIVILMLLGTTWLFMGSSVSQLRNQHWELFKHISLLFFPDVVQIIMCCCDYF